MITLGDPSTAAATLTFDCGSDLGDTNNILDLLRRDGITVAFGVTGRFAELYPDAVRRMIAEGHQLINHSYDHPAFTTLSTAQRNQQLDRTEQLFAALGRTSAGWFRPPYFDRNAAVDTDLAAHGYYIELLATIDTLGWQVTPRTTPQQVVTTVLSKLRPGAIILMHVGSTSVDYAALARSTCSARSAPAATASPPRRRRSPAGRSARTIGSSAGPARCSACPAPPNSRSRAADGNCSSTAACTGRRPQPRMRCTGQSWANTGRWAAPPRSSDYPTTDELATPDTTGRYNHFANGGSIYWTPSTGGHEVHGAIRVKWAQLGWERGPLGYPTSDEYTIAGGRRSDFQHGSISWNSATNTTTVTLRP